MEQDSSLLSHRNALNVYKDLRGLYGHEVKAMDTLTIPNAPESLDTSSRLA